MSEILYHSGNTIDHLEEVALHTSVLCSLGWPYARAPPEEVALHTSVPCSLGWPYARAPPEEVAFHSPLPAA